MNKQSTVILVAAGALGIAGATSFLVTSSHQADDQACRQDAPPAAPGTHPPDTAHDRRPEECDHHPHSSGGMAFLTGSGRGDNDDDSRAGRTGGGEGEAESAGHAGFGGSAAGHGGGGE
ncbi:hypothetical protein [Gluconacetobacter takamatsuzukensis]|uniref:Uncharacterized protein n=1 Tax=Gluconacetobacter takamatsuzukensis TaxID=1286190 RepID=A0A7W4KCT0_9PROT|nr:hypothetical protein [Gluconacetobacter takamatsuzukensis]MBB2204574.1 hypothetical protein [Gluconacetobacter takamatsuzukensis]